jgi:hypothetical protein
VRPYLENTQHKTGDEVMINIVEKSKHGKGESDGVLVWWVMVSLRSLI